MTLEEELMDVYRYTGRTDGQARDAAKEFLARVREGCAKIADSNPDNYVCCGGHCCNCRSVKIAEMIRALTE